MELTIVGIKILLSQGLFSHQLDGRRYHCFSQLSSSPEEAAEEFTRRLPDLWQSIMDEAVPSTRILMEWFVILGLVKHENAHNLRILKSRLLEFTLPTGPAISLVTITFHVGKCLEGELQKEFLENIFDLLLPWFLHNHHVVRMYVLYVFKNLWCLPVVDKTSLPVGYVNTAAFIESSEHCKKFLEKLSKDYYLSVFHPIKDFNIQTIFFTLPRSLGLAESELISMNVCNMERNIPFGSGLSDADLVNVPPDQETQPEQAPLNDYQQKIDPWNMQLLEQDLSEIGHQQEIARKKRDFDIVVVASLIDRIPNLAGLSRTCEILGVGTFVIPDIKIIDDPNFQNVSMTSEKWLDIIEVKPSVLDEYLEKMRMSGYRVMAIEQSSQSKSLVNFVFPERCVLLLGNEKEGVPAELLHIVDDCLEIPQFGMIRSMNVHVCGSLVIWEARKQRIKLE